MTLDQAIQARGLDVKREIRNLKRRQRYAAQQDRQKVWPGDTTISVYTWHRNPDQASRDLAALRQPQDTQQYVSLWCKLNHLTQ